MKKMLTIIICLAILLSGCVPSANVAQPSDDSTNEYRTTALNNNLRGVWISYFEMNFGNLSESEFTSKITAMFKNIADASFNAVFVHLRANSDAFYPSAIFPWAKQLTGSDGSTPDYDPLEIMINSAHSLGLEFHGWLNPYRVSATVTDPGQLQDGTPAKIWLTDSDTDNDNRAIRAAGGIYYNPASAEVRQLIIDGVSEIVRKYDVDGIHFDDYFYPTTDESFDKSDYESYKSGGGNLSLGDWRRENVNTLVKAVYSIVNAEGKVFGISPAAAISQDRTDRNYTELYADVTLWMSNSGYIDYIAPQLYFGFEYKYASFNFDVLIEKWTALPRLDSVQLYIGLAGYKTGTTDAGTTEWCEKSDILARQYSLLKSANCGGFILYSYSSLVNSDPLFAAQMTNLRESIKG